MQREVGADTELKVVTESCFRDHSRKNLTAESLKIWLFLDIELQKCALFYKH
jgi:hypothetical protein